MLRSQQLKKFSAIAGSTAFGVMVVHGVGLAERQTATGTAVSDPVAKLGETATNTTPPAQPVTSKAAPPFTSTTPPGFATPH